MGKKKIILIYFFELNIICCLLISSQKLRHPTVFANILTDVKIEYN